MRFIGFIAVALLGKILFGDGAGYYVLVVVACFALNPFGLSMKKQPSEERFRVTRAEEEEAAAPEVPLPLSGIPSDAAFIEETDGPLPARSHSPSLTIPESRRSAWSWTSVTFVAVGLVVIVSLVMKDRNLRSESDSTAKYADVTGVLEPGSGGGITENENPGVVARVYEPSKCELRFPQLSNEEMNAQFGRDWGWRLRSAQVRVFCAHEWDEQRIAEAARIAETNGLLLWQWNETARAASEEMSPYLGFPPDFAAFAKVMDSALLFVLPEAQIAELRQTNPRMPAPAAIAQAREELRLEENAVRAGATPQRFTISSISPRVRFITDVGLSRSLEGAMQQTMAVAGSGYVQLNEAFLNRLGTSMVDRGNMTAALPAMQLEHALSEVAQSRAASSPLPDLDIYFLQSFNEGVMQKLRDRPAMYDPENGCIYVLNNKDAAEMIDSHRVDRRATLDLTLPAALWHELDHYLYDDAELAESGFYIEGFATASGEHSRRTMEAAAHAVDEEEFLAIRQEIATTESPTDEQRTRWIKAAYDRIRKAPMTAMQCTNLALVHREFVRRGRDIPIAQMLELPPRMFQSKAYGNVALNYAVAWSVLAAIDEDEERRQRLRRVAAAVSASPLSEDDRRFLAELGTSTKQWIGETNGKREILCAPEKPKAVSAQ